MLRLTGLIIGLIGLIVTFVIFRGSRWKRANFIFFGAFSLGLIITSLNPGVLNIAAEIFQLQLNQRGRILVLLIGSNIILWFSLLYFKSGLDDYKYQFDLLIRRLGRDAKTDELKAKISDKDIMVIIPAYNEEKNLSELLSRLPDKILDKNVGVLIIDDGSTDRTSLVAAETGHLVVENKINRGQGAAARLGYDILRDNNIQIGVTMDADNQHLPEELQTVVTPVLNNEYDLIIGSRVLGQGFKNTLLRGTGIHLFSKTINFATGLKLTDCSSGYRAFNVKKISQLDLKEDQFQAAEVIIEAAKKGLKIGEVPITIVERKYGHSKKGRDLKYGFLFAKAILKSWWK